MTNIDLGRPLQGDVVDLILDDHRRFEALLRDLRDSSQDRDAVRRAFAALHVAHAEAEEKHVYPKLERKNAWGVLHQDGSLTVSVGEASESTELRKHPV